MQILKTAFTSSPRRLRSLWKGGLALGLGFPLFLAGQDFQGSTQMVPFDEEMFQYGKAEPHDPIAKLQKRINNGELKLPFDEKFGYLPALLKELKVPASSQMLVFSKTSLQRYHIRPKNPRAIFYNDDAYVGYIPSAPLMELTGIDPKLGGVFYALEQKPVEKPQFVRNNQCLECHAGAKTMGVPGHLIRSFITDKDGEVDLLSGVSLISHRTPLADRWGGWYVSGTHGDQIHRGNLVGKEDFERQEKKPNFRGNVTDLSAFFHTDKHLEPGSDIVSLMVFEHQAHMHNFIARIHYDATTYLEQYHHVKYLKSIFQAFLKYLLFTEEAALTSPLKGSSSFAQDFAGMGPRDSKGRSLRDLDLQTRLFKYPCSFLIYSDAFDNLPGPAKDEIYRRLYDVLTNQDPSDAFARVTAEDRQAILEILRDTKKGLPDYWKPGKQVAAQAEASAPGR